jgi:hypothetical protein
MEEWGGERELEKKYGRRVGKERRREGMGGGGWAGLTHFS